MPQPASRYFLVLFVLLLSSWAFGQRLKTEPFDVLNYQFNIALNDTSNVVRVEAKVAIHYPNLVPALTVLDLASPSENTGMNINDLTFNGNKSTFTHESDLLKIVTPNYIQKGDTSQLYISYTGIPDNGLVISYNAHGDRTFFAEHWPNRAHRWLPVIDHPSEKATCEFIVTAPAKYQVVANGDLQSEKMLTSVLKKTTWKMSKPISAKVMVIGVAPFTTRVLNKEGTVTAWVYKESGDQAARDFADAPAILEVLKGLMGDYPFSKCDQVESTTRFGGMENAGNIFYPERSLTGERKINQVIAHEIAHQWFGNAVTEANWADIWISEGFATFFENYWVEETLGTDSLLAKLAEEEIKILNYERSNPKRTIVQKDFFDLDKLMNALTYDKAGWMLRTLRQKVGKELFMQVIHTFYERYKYSTASTEDFIDVANEVSLLDLNHFFRQWLYVEGSPSIAYSWRYKKDKLILEFEQQTDHVYELDLDILLKHQNMNFGSKRVMINQRNQTIEIPCERVVELELDPLNIILGKFHEK